MVETKNLNKHILHHEQLNVWGSCPAAIKFELDAWEVNPDWDYGRCLKLKIVNIFLLHV